MYESQRSVPKELYSPSVIMKAAYSMLDEAYFHMEDDGSAWKIHISAKGQNDSLDLPAEFENQLIAFAVREQVYKRTKTLREILLARSMTSTIIEREDPVQKITAEEMDVSQEELDTILTDWFERYEK